MAVLVSTFISRVSDSQSTTRSTLDMQPTCLHVVPLYGTQSVNDGSAQLTLKPRHGVI